MNPLFPTPGMLLAILLVSEPILMRKRLSGDSERTADRGSLLLLMAVIFASVVLAWLAGRALPGARLAALLSLDSASIELVHRIGVGVFAAGLGLRWWAIAWLGRLFTFDVAIAADHRVIDTGPYRLIRHPAYTGSLLSFVGIGICGGNVVSLLLLVVPHSDRGSGTGIGARPGLCRLLEPHQAPDSLRLLGSSTRHELPRARRNRDPAGA
jgi:protein-S-isoprenylcysteine O-methyltransferase